MSLQTSGIEKPKLKEPGKTALAEEIGHSTNNTLEDLCQQFNYLCWDVDKPKKTHLFLWSRDIEKWRNRTIVTCLTGCWRVQMLANITGKEWNCWWVHSSQLKAKHPESHASHGLLVSPWQTRPNWGCFDVFVGFPAATHHRDPEWHHGEPAVIPQLSHWDKHQRLEVTRLTISNRYDGYMTSITNSMCYGVSQLLESTRLRKRPFNPVISRDKATNTSPAK